MTAGSGAARQMLVGGYQNPGSACVFMAVTYDVTDTTPVELARVQSASFSTADPQDHSWALAPDGRYVAMYLQDTSSPTHRFVLYDIESQQFGDVLAISMGNASVTKQVAWLDAQHFVIDHISGGVRGLRVLARSGLDVIDLGFFGVWGAGSSTTRQPLSYAQFTPLAGGLINYMTDVTGPTFTTIYARSLAWQNNNLVIGAAYTLVSGLTPGSGSAANANFVQTGGGEWTLCYATIIYYSPDVLRAGRKFGSHHAPVATDHTGLRHRPHRAAALLRRPAGAGATLFVR